MVKRVMKMNAQEALETIKYELKPLKSRYRKRSYSDMTNKIRFAVLIAKAKLRKWTITIIINIIIVIIADRL